jgi:predicted Zn-dependent protease with MMP-like domain
VFGQGRRQAGEGREEDLYGLYEGVPYGQRGPDYQMTLPDRITLFKRAIERDSPTRAEMIRCSQETGPQEIGHYFGMDDRQLDELGIG